MAKFITRRLLLMLLTMFLVSLAVFAITTAAPGNVARNVLGIQITREQEESFLAQNGLDRPMYERYLYWLAGTDWKAGANVGLPPRQITTSDGFKEWWAVEKDGTLIQWRLEGDNLILRQRQRDGKVVEKPDNDRWHVQNPGIETARLEKYRADLATNPQLTDADRQAILAPLDQILAVLRGKDQSQAVLLAALAQPEAALDALQDPKAAKTKQGIQKAAATVAGNDTLLQALAVNQRLNGPTAGSLTLSDMQFMAGRLSRAAAQLRDVDADSATKMQQAYESLKGGDAAAAKTTLAGLAPVLQHLTANLGDLTDAVAGGNYQAAAATLRNLDDPAKTPFDAGQLKVLPATLQALANAMDDADGKLGDPMLEGVTKLKAGKIDDARKAYGQAAGVLGGIGQVIARSDAARQARVARTFWGLDAQNHAVRWETGSGKEVWVFIQGTGWKAFTGGPMEYIPLQKGLLRGDPGVSLRTGRPVADLLFLRLRNSLVLAVATVAIVMLLIAPTMVLVHLRFPRLRRWLEVVALLPIALPSIALVVGLAPIYLVIGRAVGTGIWSLAFAYGITCLPFAYRALQANLDAVDTRTLAEAARSLGASWGRVLLRVIAPNVRRGLMLAALISVAVVLGEFTIASLLSRQNLQTALVVVSKIDPFVAVIMSLLSLALVFVLLLVIDRVGRLLAVRSGR